VVDLERRFLGRGGEATPNSLLKRWTQGAVAELLPARLRLVHSHDRPAPGGRTGGVEDLALGKSVACGMHRGESDLVLLLRTAREVMHDCVCHIVLQSNE